MRPVFKENDIVVFKEGHQWVGTLGYIDEVMSNKYLVCVPLPEKKITYIFDDGTGIEHCNTYPFRIGFEGDEDEDS